MALVVVRGDDRTALLEQRAVACRAIADAQGALLQREILRPDDAWGAADEGEDLAPFRVDDRDPFGRAGRKRCEGRDAGARNVERERKAARDREPDADTREAARAETDREPVEVGRVRTGLAQQRVNVLEQHLRPRDALTEHFAVVDERARRDRRRRIESQGQHSSISTALPAPACRKRTAKRGAGRMPRPPSGHSTKAIAPSKYGSRPPHSAGETPSKR